MKRTKERQSMTLALVRYSRFGIAKSGANRFDIYRKIQGVCGKDKTLAYDMFAVHQLLFFLWVQDDAETLKIIQEVYFLPFSESASKHPRRNEISQSIFRFACENHMDERTVYRKLRKVYELWTKIRYEK